MTAFLPTRTVPYAPATQGQLRAQLQTPSFRITEANYATGTRFAAHAHEHPSITAVFRGGFCEAYRRREEVCAARSLLIKPAAEVHSNIYGNAPTSCLLVAMTRSIPPLERIFNQTIHLRGGIPYSLAVALRDEIRIGDDLAPVAAEGLLLELMAMVARTAPPTDRIAPRWLFRLRDELRARCRERLRMSDVAAIGGVHPIYAARLFRRHFGLTPIDFLRRCRIEWATTALLETTSPISEISIAAGFSDQSHFTRAFTGLAGRTPKSVRQSGARSARGRGE